MKKIILGWILLVGIGCPIRAMDVKTTTQLPSVSAVGCLQTNASGSVLRANCPADGNSSVQIPGLGGLNVTYNVGGGSLTIGSTVLACNLPGYAGRCGVGTATPGATLDVNGAMRATGYIQADTSFTAVGATFSVTNAGVVSAPSQPDISLYMTASPSYPDSTSSSIYWDTIWSSANITYNMTTASDTVTIPAAGNYLLTCGVLWATSATGYRQVLISSNVSDIVKAREIPSSSVNTSITVSKTFRFKTGDSVKCYVYQTSGGGLGIVGGVASSYFTVTKLW